MIKTVSLFAGVGLLAIGCASGADVSETENVAGEETAITGGTATLTYTSDAGTSYCANVALSNALGSPTTRWQAVIDVKTNNITSVSGALKSATTGKVTFTPSTATSIAAGATATFSFCATASSATVRPAIFAWNMESSAYGTCGSNSGLYPTKAALAVAMAKELGRWTPATDLTIIGTRNTSSARVVLSSAGLAACGSNCANTKAILGQQDASFVDQNLFSAMNYIGDLGQSFDRQNSLLTDLQRNNPSALPPAHKLTQVAGPTNLGKGSCGPHYIFQVDSPTGMPLTTAQANNMVNTMCFYSAGSCGSNPYIGFQVTTTNGCPTGKTCIAIDPTDGDNSSTSTTTAGSAPTYPMNRVWNSDNSLLGTGCITTAGKASTLVSQCVAKPNTCGYLYCL
jgi:hypothetical protein